MTSNNLVVADTPEAVDTFRMIALCGALKLELLGMKGRGRSAYSIIKQEYGLRGNKQSVLDQFTALKNDAVALQRADEGLFNDGSLGRYDSGDDSTARAEDWCPETNRY